MTTSVSRNYAKALFDLAAVTSSADDIEQELRAARQTLWDDAEVRKFLSNRLISRMTKKKLVRTAFEGKVDERLLTFLFLLLDRGRAALLGEIGEEFGRLCRLSRGVRKVTVYSAFPLGGAEKTMITRSLEKRLSVSVELETEVRPALIGGVVAVSEGQEIEFSIEGRLRDLAAHIGSIGTK